MPIEEEFNPSEGNPFIGSHATEKQDEVAPQQTLSSDVSESEKDTKQSAWSELSRAEKGRLIGAGAALAMIGSIGVAAAPGITEALTPDEKRTSISTYTVQPGDELQNIINEHYDEVKDWRDIASEIEKLNPDLFSPGHVLMPGDTLTIPVPAESKE